MPKKLDELRTELALIDNRIGGYREDYAKLMRRDDCPVEREFREIERKWTSAEGDRIPIAAKIAEYESLQQFILEVVAEAKNARN